MPKINKKIKKPNSKGSKINEQKLLERLVTLHISQNNTTELENLFSIENNVEILLQNRFFDPFVIAIKANQLHFLQYLNKTSFHLKTNDGDTYCRALIEAIKCSNEEAIDQLINNYNIDVNSSNYKHVPLQIAYNIYSCEKEKSLVITDYDTSNLNKSYKVFRKLLINKADPNVYNSKGYRLIHQIVIDKDIEILEMIIEICGQNLKVNTLTYGKMQNSLHLISETKKKQTRSKMAINELNLKLAKILLSAGCNMNHTDYQLHETPAFKAIVNNYYELVKFFVIQGMNMGARNRCGNDVLSRSIQLGRYKIARLLIACNQPIRVYSCFYKIPNIDEFKSSNRIIEPHFIEEEDTYNEELINDENFLQYSIARYEKFLIFLQRYTQEPRSLTDLCRLSVRNQINKPISKWLPMLRIPRQIQDIILLRDIENVIKITC